MSASAIGQILHAYKNGLLFSDLTPEQAAQHNPFKFYKTKLIIDKAMYFEDDAKIFLARQEKPTGTHLVNSLIN